MDRELTQEEELTNAETMRHILTLRTMLMQCTMELSTRAMEHDLSKLSDPEVALFTEYTPKLKGMEYGSPEYKQCINDIFPALENHYAKNRHHPEHFAEGINDMNLFDLVEMMCDWKSSSLRGKNGCLSKSMDIQKNKLDISEQLFRIMKNTVPVIDRMAKRANIHVSYPQHG